MVAGRIHLLIGENSALSAAKAALTANGYESDHHGTYEALRDALAADVGGLQAAVIEVRGSDHSGVRQVNELCVRLPHVPLIVVGDSDNIQLCGLLMRVGAHDYLVKPIADRTIIEAVGSALNRSSFLGSIFQEISHTGRKVLRLTVREREVLDLVVEGDQSKTIAKKLGISEKTVEAHRYKVMQKMECGSVAHVVRLFAKYQLWHSLVEARRRWSAAPAGNGSGPAIRPAATPATR